MLLLVHFLTIALQATANSPTSACNQAQLLGSGVQNSYTTPAKTFLKKAFVQKMSLECVLNWTELSEPLSLAIPATTILTKLLNYDVSQIENFQNLSAEENSAPEIFTSTETPIGEKWRFRLKSRLKIVTRPDFFDILSEAAANGYAGTQLEPIPGGSPGSERVKYIQFRVRADRVAPTQIKLRFETMSALDISGFAAGIAFKIFQGSSNQDALRKFETATRAQAQRIGGAL